MATNPFTLAADETGRPAPTANQDTLKLVVYKDPHCGGCDKWAENMEAHGFSVESVLESDMSARKQRHAYDVLLFDPSGQTKRFEHYPARP